MKHCTKCGKETTAKICPHCGNYSRKAGSFCPWCGHEVNQSAVMCPNCHEKLRDGFGGKLRKVIAILIALVLLIIGIGFLVADNAFLSALFCFVAAILFLPFIRKIIRNATFGSKAKRKIFSIIRVIAILCCVVLIFVSLPDTPAQEPVQNKIYSDVATNEAVKVFHDEVSLKNEASFVLNDSRVTYVDSYDGNDNLALVTVVLDYSAQNGFGGMNRDTYTVQLIFNYAHGTYRPVD